MLFQAVVLRGGSQGRFQLGALPVEPGRGEGRLKLGQQAIKLGFA